MINNFSLCTQQSGVQIRGIIIPCLHLLSPFQRWLQLIFQLGCEKGKVMMVGEINTPHFRELNEDERLPAEMEV